VYHCREHLSTTQHGHAAARIARIYRQNKHFRILTHAGDLLEVYFLTLNDAYAPLGVSRKVSNVAN
jgi:hypothetical protein